MAITGIWFASADAEWWKYAIAIIVANAYIGIAMVHNDIVVIPYAMSDMVTTIATVPLPDLLRALKTA